MVQDCQDKEGAKRKGRDYEVTPLLPFYNFVKIVPTYQNDSSVGQVPPP